MAENVLCLALWLLRLVQASQDSQEADPLQQALLLVDLLKAEYAKVRKENVILRQRELQTQGYDAADERTCPTTLSAEYELSPGVGRRAYFPLENSLTPHPSKRNKHFFKSRRLEYDDAFGPHPGGGDTSQPSNDTSTTVKQTTIPTSQSSTMTTLTSQLTKRISSAKFTKIGRSTKKTNSPRKTEPKKIPLNYKKTSKTTIRDPIMEQVASEIISEMKDPKRSTVNKLSFYSAPLWSGKTEKNTRFENFSKGTLKIHQATSKRYPIPLPENNAYCFFHPHSSLCRTFI